MSWLGCLCLPPVTMVRGASGTSRTCCPGGCAGSPEEGNVKQALIPPLSQLQVRQEGRRSRAGPCWSGQLPALVQRDSWGHCRWGDGSQLRPGKALAARGLGTLIKAFVFDLQQRGDGGLPGSCVSVCICAAGDRLCQTETLHVLGWGRGGGWRARGWAQRLQLKRTSVLRGLGSWGPLGEALSWRWHRGCAGAWGRVTGNLKAGR